MSISRKPLPLLLLLLIACSDDPVEPERKPDVARYEATWGQLGATLADFERPAGVDIDAAGNVYVADMINDRVKVHDSSGRYVRTIGVGVLDNPVDVAVGETAIYVAQNLLHRIAKFNLAGSLMQSFGVQGSGDRQFRFPSALALDDDGLLYVTDTRNHRVQVLDGNGQYQREWGSQGVGPGEFSDPEGIAIDSDGNIYVSDSADSRIAKGVRKNRIQVFSPEGVHLWTLGDESGSGPGEFSDPQGLAFDASGRLFVADANNDRIQVFDVDGEYLAEWGGRGSAAGKFNYPAGLVFLPDGRLVVSDLLNHRLQVFSLVLND